MLSDSGNRNRNIPTYLPTILYVLQTTDHILSKSTVGLGYRLFVTTNEKTFIF